MKQKFLSFSNFIDFFFLFTLFTTLNKPKKETCNKFQKVNNIFVCFFSFPFKFLMLVGDWLGFFSLSRFRFKDKLARKHKNIHKINDFTEKAGKENEWKVRFEATMIISWPDIFVFIFLRSWKRRRKWSRLQE